jgi:hypothetical protein
MSIVTAAAIVAITIPFVLFAGVLLCGSRLISPGVKVYDPKR